MAAEADLGELGISEEILRREWAAQVSTDKATTSYVVSFLDVKFH